MSHDATAPEPVQDLEQAAYWEALTDGRFELPQCQGCGSLLWYPRSRCPSCMSDEIELRTMSGRATVFSYTANQRAGTSREGEPVLVAYVDLDEGPRMLANVVGVRTADLRIGMRLAAVVDRAPSGAGFLRFTVAPPAEERVQRG